jgi:hypothetical protein
MSFTVSNSITFSFDNLPVNEKIYVRIVAYT